MSKLRVYKLMGEQVSLLACFPAVYSLSKLLYPFKCAYIQQNAKKWQASDKLLVHFNSFARQLRVRYYPNSGYLIANFPVLLNVPLVMI